MGCTQCINRFRGEDALVRCRKHHFCNFIIDGQACARFNRKVDLTTVIKKEESTFSLSKLIEPLLDLYGSHTSIKLSHI